MTSLAQADTLVVQQRKEWAEILTGFETKNKYSVMNRAGEQMYWAAEESSVLARMFLKALRPFSIHVLLPQGQPALRLEKPFRFYFHEISVAGSNGRPLGSVKREFSILNRKFTVMDTMGREVFKIFGPFFRPWTFRILRNGSEVGKISKKWSGLGKELFTDADNFNIAFPPRRPTRPERRAPRSPLPHRHALFREKQLKKGDGSLFCFMVPVCRAACRGGVALFLGRRLDCAGQEKEPRPPVNPASSCRPWMEKTPVPFFILDY